jgi:hypothetical protein
VLEGEFKEGDVIRIDAVGGTLQFARADRPVADATSVQSK